MMQKLVILAVAALCLSASTTTADHATKEQNFALTQKTVWDLLWHFDQPKIVHPEISRLGTSWDIEANLKLYTNEVAVREFLERFRRGMLPRGEIFSVFNEDHLEESMALFDLFYYAGDIQTFLNTAAWARVYVNEYQFYNVFYVAIMHRRDTAHIRLPRPSEMQPYLFFNADVMQRVYDHEMSFDPHNSTTEPFIVNANYSYWYDSNTRDPETKLSYFREDIGLNNFYSYMNYEFPFWISTKKYNLSSEYRGELYFYLHKVLFNRYKLERYSHGMPEVELCDLDRPIATGFTPYFSYRNGRQFPQRKEWSYFPSHMYGYLQKAKEYESRVAAAIDFGHFGYPTKDSKDIYNSEGLNLLGFAISGSVDSPNRKYYGFIDQLFRILFGFSPEPYSKYQLLPSALEHYPTSMRDPAFYIIFKRIVSLYERYKENLQPYTRDHLNCKGIEIDSVAVDKMVTYFDFDDHFVSNAVKVHSHERAESNVIKARQYRLNHKPYSYHITVKSDRDTKVIIRIFLGPKYNVHGKELDISENYRNFYQFEYFIADVKAGSNKIERRCTEASFMRPDYDSSDIYYEKIVEAVKNNSELPFVEKLQSFPERLALPRGRPDGLELKLFFYVSEYSEESSVEMESRILGRWRYDKEAFGFPLDRRVFSHNFTTPNMHMKTIRVYHEGAENPNYAW